MKTYFLTFFFCLSLFCVIEKLYGQTSQTDASPTTTTTSEQKSTSTPINPADPFGDLDSTHNKLEKETDSFQSKFLNMLLILGLMVGFMVLASVMLKRLMRNRVSQMNQTSVIKLLETRNLSHKATLYLLDIQGQGYIIAESATGITAIDKISLTEEEE